MTSAGDQLGRINLLTPERVRSAAADSPRGSLFDADGDGEPEIVYYNGFRGGEHIDASTDPADCGMWSAATTTAA